jgi:hypothetical protein
LALFVPGAISEGARWLEACGALGAAQLKQGLRSRAAGDAEAAGSGSEMGKRGWHVRTIQASKEDAHDAIVRGNTADPPIAEYTGCSNAAHFPSCFPG